MSEGRDVVDSVEDALRKAADRDVDLLLYDYFKHMTSLALITLGGLVSIPQFAEVGFATREVAIPILLVTMSGTLALYGQEEIIVARQKARRVPRQMRWCRWAISGSFGIGVGAFLSLILGDFRF
jgi:hypothetical protein